MATRRLVIFVGDDFAGQAPASGLVGPLAGYAQAQTNYKVWNSGAVAWQNYWPGNNGSSVFGPEILLRQNANGFGALELLYLFKYSASGILGGWDNSKDDVGVANAGTNYVAFKPELRQAAFTNLMTQLGGALATILASGDTAKVEAFVLAFGVVDAIASTGQKSFCENLLSLFRKVREKAEASLGLAPGDLDAVPVRLLKIPGPGIPPASGFARMNWDVIKQQTELAAEMLNGVVVPTDSAQLLSSSYYHDAVGEIEVGGNLQRSIFGPAAVASEPANPNDLYLILGDSKLEGDEASDTYPGYLSGGLPTQIWNPHASTSGRFELLTIDNCRPCNIGDMFGPEATFAEAAQQSNRRPTFIVKACQANYLIPSGPSDSTLFPFYDESVGSWDWRSFYSRAILGWASDAAYSLSRFSLTGRLRGIVIGLGTYDAWAGSGKLVGSALALLVQRLQAWAKRKLLTNEDVPVVFVLPDTRDGKGATAQMVADARDSIMALPGARYYDPSGLAKDDDGNYLSSSWLLMGAQVFSALAAQTFKPGAVPLFSPDRAYLIAGIRLRDVPTEANAQEVIDEAILSVKASFYRRLGQDRIDAIKSVSFTRNPNSEAEYLRLLAQTTETKAVRMELMRTMPMSFMDGNVTDQIWQKEAAFRAATGAALASEQKQLRLEIDQALEVLAGKVELTEEQRAKVMVFEAEEDDSEDIGGCQGGVL